MILFTAKDFNMLHRGAALLGERWAKMFPNHIEYKEQALVQNWAEEAKRYSKIVLLSQSPKLYSTPPYFHLLKDVPHIFTIRPDEKPYLYNSATNCFSLFKEDENFKIYLPRFLSPPKIIQKEKERTIGFYSRPNVSKEAVTNFWTFLDNLEEKINLKILGESTLDYSSHPNVKSYSHTYSNVEFFSEITHFVYFYISKPDPFPHTLLEAINLNLQIIIPNEVIQHDGVYDVLTLTNFHKELNSETLDNKDCLLTEENFLGFYNHLVSIGFEYSFPRNLYSSYYDWIVGEVLPRKEYRLS